MNDRSNMVKVAVVGGEGIGPEVTAQSQRVLNWFAANAEFPWSCAKRNTASFPISRPER